MVSKPHVIVPELKDIIDIYTRHTPGKWDGAVFYGNASRENSVTEGVNGFGAYEDDLFVLVEDFNSNQILPGCEKECIYEVNFGVDQRIGKCEAPQPLHWLLSHSPFNEESLFCIEYSSGKFSEHLPIKVKDFDGYFYIGKSPFYEVDHFVGQYKFKISDIPPDLPPVDLTHVPPVYRGTIGWHTVFGNPKKNRGLPILNQLIQDGNTKIEKTYYTNRDEWKDWADVTLPKKEITRVLTETLTTTETLQGELTTKTERLPGEVTTVAKSGTMEISDAIAIFGIEAVTVATVGGVLIHKFLKRREEGLLRKRQEAAAKNHPSK